MGRLPCLRIHGPHAPKVFPTRAFDRPVCSWGRPSCPISVFQWFARLPDGCWCQSLIQLAAVLQLLSFDAILEAWCQTGSSNSGWLLARVLESFDCNFATLTIPSFTRHMLRNCLHHLWTAISACPSISRRLPGAVHLSGVYVLPSPPGAVRLGTLV